MTVEENSLSKSLHKIELWLIKVIPFVMAFLYFLNTVLSYFNIDIVLLSYIGGISLLPLLFIYLCSFVYKFCLFNRLPIYYITINWVLNITDYYIQIPINNRSLISIYLMITFIFIALLIYEHCKRRSIKIVKRNSR